MYKKTDVSVCVSHCEPLITAGLTAVLGDIPGFHVLTQDPERTVPLQQLSADILIVDYQTGMSMLGQGSSHELHAKLLMVTEISREWEVRAAINAGVYGYLLQSSAIVELLDAVHSLSRGARFISSAVSRSLADSLTRQALTVRETEVLQLLAIGFCNKLIADQLAISVGTVKAHVRSVLEKLAATSRTHAVVVAVERGLVRHRVESAVENFSLAAATRFERQRLLRRSSTMSANCNLQVAGNIDQRIMSYA
ncbi:MAG: response regulator transcription factor [Polaromonas sp.]|nr:response regulator transcription factor [Polaromonas sp.]